MSDCYEGMLAALRRNIEGLAHLSADQKKALLDQEMAQAVAATEAGRPLVEIYGPTATEEAPDEAPNSAA